MSPPMAIRQALAGKSTPSGCCFKLEDQIHVRTSMPTNCTAKSGALLRVEVAGKKCNQQNNDGEHGLEELS